MRKSIGFRHVEQQVFLPVFDKLVLFFVCLFLAALSSKSQKPGVEKASLPADKTLIRIVPNTIYTEWCSISPDGVWLSFTDSTGNLILKNILNGAIKKITTSANWSEGGHAMWAKFSRDGKQIAYYWADANSANNEIRIQKIGETNYRTLVKVPEGWTIPTDWSQDGKYLLAARNDQIVIISVKDGMLNVVPTNAKATGLAVFSPDGKWIVHNRYQSDSSGHTDIWIMSINGTEAKPLIVHYANDAVVSWTEDGTLFFTSDRTGQVAYWKGKIQDGLVTGKFEKAMPELEGLFTTIGVTRKKDIVFSIAMPDLDIYHASLDLAQKKATLNPNPLTQHTTGANSYPHWSPDGNKFLYLSSPSFGSRKIFVQDNNGKEVEIKPVMNGFNRPQWHPSGEISFTGSDISGSDGIYAINTKTNVLHQLIDTKLNETLFHGQWSKDGLWFYNRYKDATKGEYRLNVQTKEKKTLYTPPAGWITQGSLLSPDDNTLALGIANPQQGAKIILVDTKTGNSKDLITAERYHNSFPCCRPWTWTPDSKSLLVARNESDNTKLYLISADNGTITRILSGEGITNPHLNPNGKDLLLEMGKRREEIWILKQ